MARQDVIRALPLAAAHGLVMSTLYVLKPVRNSLFLDRLGVAQLPYVLLAVAVAGAGAASLYGRFARTVRIGPLIRGSFVVLMLFLLLFRAVLGTGGAVVLYAFYIWVTLYGLLSTSLVWLLAASAFDARAARRSFGFIGAGGIIGATAGGVFTRWAAHAIGTLDLLLVCVALLVLCLVCLARVRAIQEPEQRQDLAAGALTAIRRSPLLRSLAAMAALVAVVAVITDIQFNEIVDRSFATRDAKTAFFGGFFAALSAFAFVFQILLTPRILAGRGVGVALLFLPLALAAGSVGLFVAPALWSAIMVKVGDGGFRHSIHKAATEILMIPVPTAVKSRTKVFLDATVDTVGTGVGAVLVLALTGVGVSYPALSLVSLVLIGGWLWLTTRVRSAYVDAFRMAIERREIDLGELRAGTLDASSLSSLGAALGGSSERQLVYALDLLAAVPEAIPVEAVRPLVAHASPEVRRKAVRVLQGVRDDDTLLAEVERLLDDPDPETRLEAVRFLCARADGGARSYLAHPDPSIQAAALVWIAETGDAAARAAVDDAQIAGLLGGPREDARALVARALGGLPELRRHLEPLAADPSPRVVAEAIDSAGRLGDPVFVPWLLERLVESRYRIGARAALVAHGPAILPAIEARLADRGLPRAMRIHLPRVVSEIPTQASVDLLLRRLGAGDPGLDRMLIKALSRLRARQQGLRFDPTRVDGLLRGGLRAYGDLAQLFEALPRESSSAPARLLRRAVDEKRAVLLEETFRLLGLRHPPRDMFNAYHGVVSDDRMRRNSALEFVDNVIDPAMKPLLMPLLESDGASPPASMRNQAPVDAFVALLAHDDPWLRACAAFASSGHTELLAAACEDADPLVREAARAALRVNQC